MEKYTDTQNDNSEYYRVGSRVPVFDTRIGIDEAERLRQYVAIDFFDAMNTKTLILTEQADRSVAGRGFHFHPSFDGDNQPSVFVGANLYQTYDESWRLVIMTSKMKRLERNSRAQRVTAHYRLAVVADNLMQATKEVKVVRAIGDMTVDDIEDDSGLEVQRKIYERPMVSDDCGVVIGFLGRAIKRQQAQR